MTKEMTAEQIYMSKMLTRAIVSFILFLVMGTILGVWIKLFWIGFVFAR